MKSASEKNTSAEFWVVLCSFVYSPLHVAPSLLYSSRLLANKQANR